MREEKNLIMKTTAKVLLIVQIVGSVLAIIMMLLFFAVMETMTDEILANMPANGVDNEASMEILRSILIGGIVGSVLALIVHILGLRKVSTAKLKNELTVLAVLEILIGGLLGVIVGIIMLVMKDDDLCPTINYDNYYDKNNYDG